MTVVLTDAQLEEIARKMIEQQGLKASPTDDDYRAPAEPIDAGDPEKNENFVMFYRDHLAIIDKISVEYPSALRTFMLLTQHMNRLNAVIISRKCIAEMLGISVPTVALHIKYLKSREYIKAVRTGSANVFHINANIVWRNTKQRRTYGKLQTNVLLSLSEQEKHYAPAVNVPVVGK